MLEAVQETTARNSGDATAPVAEETGFSDLRVSAADGLKLYARDYGSPHAAALPVVCLPGLARTASDFHELGLHLSSGGGVPRRVLALDYRGRGNSEWSRDWRRYDVRVEADDTLHVLTAAGIHEAIFVGTSRGGLITMALAAMRPTLVKGAILNDMGPIIDGTGLMRIRAYVGKLPMPLDHVEGGLILRRMMDAQFPKLSDGEWETMARRTWRLVKKHLELNYDPKLMKTLEAIDFDAPLPPLWHLFEGLKGVPVLALRGANSDILSQATLDEMAKRHPRLTSYVVPDHGHAPLLAGHDLLERLAQFIAGIESGGGKDRTH
jgi:pimeloyl-ACP methyl ester carboxylesterase